jgi:hypothetical protein
MKEAILMVLALVVPLLLWFLMPAVGVNESVALIIYFVLTYGALLYMTRGHSREGEENNERGHKHN